MKTVWTIGGEKAVAAGQWSGNLYENGTDGVPKVATGTFHSEYGKAGRMVGAFGANRGVSSEDHDAFGFGGLSSRGPGR